MKKALTIAAKEFRHIGHDRFTLTLTLFIPVAQLILYGYAVEIRFRDLPAAVINHDTHAAGRAFARRITDSPLISVVKDLKTEDDILAALRQGKIRAAIEIPDDFTSSLLAQKETPLRVWVDGSDVATSNTLLAALDGLGRQATIERARHLPEVKIEPAILFNPSGRSAAFLIPGLIAVLVQMITTLLMAHSIASERERGTLEQLLVMKLTPREIILGKALAVAAISLAESIVLVLVMRWLFQIPIAGSLWLLWAVLPPLVLAPIGLGLLIGCRAKTQLHALQLTQLVFLPTVLLSGFLLPQEFLNWPLNWLSDLLPTTYLVSMIRGLILRGATARELLPSLLTVVGFSVVLNLLGYWGLRRSLRNLS